MTQHNLALLILRLALGLSMATHGLQKWNHFSAFAERFPNYLGLGSEINLGLAVFAELFCALLVALGLFTRAASLPLIVTMLVAFFVAHGGDPFAKRELAFLYLAGFSTVALMGGGKWSLSQFFEPKDGLLGFFIDSKKNT